MRRISEWVLKHKLPPGVCLNVNIPSVPKAQIKGIKICRQTKANWIEELDERIDPSGKQYFWLTGKFENFEKGEEGTDVHALDNNFISVVPVQFDLTAYSAMNSIKNLEE